MRGGQLLALFNARYDDTCFQPIHIFEAAAGKPVLSLLRPGKRPSGAEAVAILRHVIARIQRNWPRVEITLRGDGHYGTPEVMELLEDQGCGYIFGLSGNARLSKIAQPRCEDAAVRRVRQGKDRARRSLWRKATFETLRRAFLKIAARVEELKSRVRVALPSAHPYQPALMSIAGRITAQGP